VINNSWGCPGEGCTSPDILKGVVENVRAGVAVVRGGQQRGQLRPGPAACSTVSDVPSFYDAATTVGAVGAMTPSRGSRASARCSPTARTA
jgi:hypothetical protein